MTQKLCLKGNMIYFNVTFVHVVSSIWFSSHQVANKIIQDIFIVVQFHGNHVVNFRWIINHKRRLKGSQKYKT